MKTTFRILSLVLFTAIFSSCMDKYTEVFTANSPIYLTYEELRAAVKKTSSRDLVNPGKIYFKDNYIFIVEEMKGIHIINAASPSNPVKEGFIEVPGCVDIAVKGSILYADSYIDLVAIDVSDFNNIREVKRIKDIFNYTVPPADNEYRMAEVDKEKGVVIDWEVKKVRQEIEYYYYPVYPMPWYRTEAMDMANFSGSYGGVGGGSGSAFGVGGSMARFGLYDSYLYTVDDSRLTMFDVTTPASPMNIGKQTVGWQVETMFIYNNYMFLGTTTGMQILDLKIPTVPTYVSNFWHATSCDPVVVADGYAYITLRGGRTCNNSQINRLDVVKLASDLKNNTLVASYPMEGPYGLGIDDEILFLCDGDAGLKVYNVADKLNIDDHKLAAFPNIKTYDVIPVNGYLFMIGDGGFYLYDYSNLNNIRQIGYIPVVDQP